ncbi:unnamed protein product [Clonostachys chloroleuca]|uniref:DUF7730 domain-containing protein n=1 Tax=Clonostachys chloroleuca TaxID=1926264 RepID=A0AA35LSF7_9HYPO|nr:unnamed protein product [Clonostachys chloroleuca]
MKKRCLCLGFISQVGIAKFQIKASTFPHVVCNIYQCYQVENWARGLSADNYEYLGLTLFMSRGALPCLIRLNLDLFTYSILIIPYVENGEYRFQRPLSRTRQLIRSIALWRVNSHNIQLADESFPYQSALVICISFCQRAAIPNDNQRRPRPRQGDIHPPQILKEPNVPVLVAPHCDEDDHVCLAALESVNAGDFDALDIRQHASEKLDLARVGSEYGNRLVCRVRRHILGSCLIRSYCEGLDVLYGTNTIHTASKQMLLHLDKLLLPQRLSKIRSVELVWYFKPYASVTSIVGPLDDLRTFYALLEAIPMTFPNPTSFYMALWGDITPRKEHNGRQVYMDEAESIKITDRDIMTPIDRMISNLSPKLRQCTIALGSLEYKIRRRQAVEAGDVEVEQIHLQNLQERHWRSLKNTPGGLKGYWIQLGHRELVKVYMCSFGEPPQNRDPPEDEVLFQPWYLMGEPRHLGM